MATTISKLNVQLALDTNPFLAGAKKAQGGAKSLAGGIVSLANLAGGRIGSLFSSLSSSLSGIGTAGAALGPVGAIAGAALLGIGVAAAGTAVAMRTVSHEMGQATERVGKFVEQSSRLGLAVANIQHLELTARTTGTSVDTLAKAMLKAGKTANGVPLDEHFASVAKEIAAIKDPGQRAAKAMEVFGKAGVELLPLLRNVEALDESRRFIERFGLAIDDLGASRVEQVGDEFAKLRFLVEGFWNKAIVAAAPAALALFDKLFDSVEKLQRAFAQAGLDWGSLETTFLVGGAVMAGALDLVTSGVMKLVSELKTAQSQLLFVIGKFDEASKVGAEALKLNVEAMGLAGKALSGDSAREFVDAASKIRDAVSASGAGGGDVGTLGGTGRPKALEKGTSAAASAVLAAGGNPLGAVEANTRKQVELAHQFLRQQIQANQLLAGGVAIVPAGL